MYNVCLYTYIHIKDHIPLDPWTLGSDCLINVLFHFATTEENLFAEWHGVHVGLAFTSIRNVVQLINRLHVLMDGP